MTAPGCRGCGCRAGQRSIRVLSDLKDHELTLTAPVPTAVTRRRWFCLKATSIFYPAADFTIRYSGEARAIDRRIVEKRFQVAAVSDDHCWAGAGESSNQSGAIPIGLRVGKIPDGRFGVTLTT